METAAQQLLTLFFVLLVLAFTAAVGWMVFHAPIRRMAAWNQNLRGRFFPAQEYQRLILTRSFEYYRQLNFRDRLRFEKRVRQFLTDKEFISRGELPITDDVKTLVAACAVQLTFGLPPVNLRHFRKIILYPDAYYSTINDKYHQGEVNAAGVIVLSWKHFLQGYRNPNDSRNVGLHEMAHALLIENRTRYDGEYNFLDENKLANFLACAETEYHRMQQGESQLLRNYALTNPAEFFSVAVEVFFENPKAMADEAPLLYQSLKELLGQDPLRMRLGPRPDIKAG
jgi:Mlc titration factor MtfA (ptsG expression regulator)